MIHPERIPLLKGKGRFVDDTPVGDALHVAFVRSPYPHAEILSVDTEDALNAPGVVAIITGRDLEGLVQPIPAELKAPAGDIYCGTRWHPIARERVRYVGEIVAAVVAENRYLAEDSAELVAVDLDPREAVADVAAAMRDGAPLLHDTVPGNIGYRMSRGNAGDHEDPFATAPVVVEIELNHPRLCGLSMEGSGVLARVDPGSGDLVVMTSTQVPHLARDGIARCLGLAPERIVLSAPDVGGAFGPKMQISPEEVIVCHLARSLGRPVKWIQDRSEHLSASFHARDITLTASMAADRDGRILGLRARALCNAGAYSTYPMTWALEPQTISVGLCGPYHVPWLDYEGLAVATNTCPVGAYRGVGFPLCALATETLLDRVAARIGTDTAEVRRRNLIRRDELPLNVTAGPLYDSGDYPRLLGMALELSNYDELCAARVSGDGAKRVTGIGICCSIELTSTNSKMAKRRGLVHIPGDDGCRLRVTEQGVVEAHISTPSQGQSQRTTFGRLLANSLELDPSQVRIVLGDTSQTPAGSGTFVSRSLVSGGGAAQIAARQLQTKLCDLAAMAWQLDAGEVAYAGGVVTAPGDPDKRLTLVDAWKIARSIDGGDGRVDDPLSVTATYDVPSMPVSAATHVAIVEVDRETGFVGIRRYIVAEDCGPVIDQDVVDGQIRGAVAQGIGSALFESITYDEEGQFLTGSLQDYLVAGSCDVPNIEIVHMQTPSPFSEGGYKGVAESGTIAAPAAIYSAVCDALGVLPDKVHLPLTPERVLQMAEVGT